MADNLMQMRPIGLLRSVFQFKNGTPRQPSLCSAARGSLTVDRKVFNNPEHALEGLEHFSHAWIVFVFHKNQPGHTKAKVKPPRLNGKRVGVFSTRSPYRPNAIGLTLAKIERISGATVHFSGIDIVDGAPVLDIKPFIPQYDVPECRGMEDSDCAGSNGYLAERCGSEPKAVAVDAETGPCDRQAGALRQNGCGPVPASENVFSRVSGTEPEERYCAIVGRGDGENDLSWTHKTARRFDQVATSVLNTQQSFCNPYSQTEGLMSDDSSNVTADINTVTSPDDFSEQQGKLEPEVSHEVCDEKLRTPLDSSGGNSPSVEGKQTPASSPQPQPPLRDSPTAVAPWLSAPPVAKLKVSFTPGAEAQLQKFRTGNVTEADNPYRLEHLCGLEDLRSAVVSMLAEDPRSVYRREKCCDSLYFFTVDQVHVTCWFEDKENWAEVVRLQPVSFVEKLRLRET